MTSLTVTNVVCNSDVPVDSMSVSGKEGAPRRYLLWFADVLFLTHWFHVPVLLILFAPAVKSILLIPLLFHSFSYSGYSYCPMPPRPNVSFNAVAGRSRS